MTEGPEFQSAEYEAERDFSPWRGALALALLMALYILSYVDRSILSLLIQPIKQDLELSDTQVSLLVGAAFSIFYATTALPLGYVADRWNRRNLIAIAVALWSVMTSLGGLAHNYTLLFLTRMGVGLGEAALAPAAYSMISDIFPKRLLARAMALFALSASVGSGLALILGGVVVNLVGEAQTASLPGVGEISTWRAILIVVGLPGLLLAALMCLVREPGRRSLPAEADRPSAPRRSAFAFVRRHARVLLPLYLGLGSISIVYYGMLTWTPTLFLRRFGIAPADIALPLGLAFAVGGVAGMLAGGFWADRLWQRGVKDGYMRVIFYSAALSLPFYTAMPLMPTPTLMLGALFCGAFCQGLQSGLPAGSVQTITPNDLRARVIAGCFLTVGLMGLGLGPTTVALGVDLLFGEAGLGQAMALSNGVVLAAASLILLAGLKPFRRAVALAPA